MDIKSICDNCKKLSKKASRELSLNEIAQMKCGFKRLVRAIESGELVPVVHGRWTRRYDDDSQDYNSDNNWEYVCSMCGKWDKHPAQYCPNCGAKMDGKDGENND